MIVSLTSNNPNFSFVIRKNPTSIPKGVLIRQGMAMGYFNGDSQYIMAFFDTPDAVSYKDFEGQFDYANEGRYSSARAVINLLSEFLGDTVKKGHQDDVEGFLNSLEVLNLRIGRLRFLDNIRKYFPDYEIEATPREYWGQNYNLVIRTSKSLQSLIAFTNLLALGVALDSNEYIDFTEELATKYITFLEQIDAPYFLRYLYKVNLLRNIKTFNSVKSTLESSQHNQYNFTWGDTWDARYAFVKSNLSSQVIVDIGAGEGRYLKRLAGSVQEYHAVDIDENQLEYLRRKYGHLSNVSFYKNHKELQVSVGIDIILTEVIEHIPLEEVPTFLKELRELPFSRLIITTPNYGFNNNYLIDGYRNEDHKWELYEESFQTLINHLFPIDNYKVTYHPVGDSVNGVSVTQGVVIEK